MQEEDTDIKRVIEQHAWALRRMGHYPNIYSALLEHGREFETAPLPADIEQGIPRECFQNCLNIADGTELIYCEGYALRPELGLLIHHAWCIDGDEKVVDPTWDNPETCFYFGVDFQIHWVWEVAKRYDCVGRTLETFLNEKENETSGEE